MHQPIPPISRKPQAVKEAGPQDQPGAAPKSGVPPQVLLTVLIGFVLAYAGSTLPVFRHPTHAAPVAVGKVVLDPDGDDPRTELLYHWQDPKFSNEEKRQIGWMVNGLALFGIYRLTRKIAKQPKEEKAGA